MGVAHSFGFGIHQERHDSNPKSLNPKTEALDPVSPKKSETLFTSDQDRLGGFQHQWQASALVFDFRDFGVLRFRVQALGFGGTMLEGSFVGYLGTLV